MFKKTFLFVSVIMAVVIGFTGCNNFKAKLPTKMTYDDALEMFFSKDASISDIQKAEESIRKNLTQEGFSSKEIEEILGSFREQKQNGTTALMAASAIGISEVVKKYIANGANVNDTDNEGMTALMYIGLGDEPGKHKDQYFEVVKTLVAAGADVNKRSNLGTTALFYVHDAKAIKELIKAGADVNAKGNGNMTALMMAIIFADSETIKTLIDAGANINDANKEGFTAIMMAIQKGNTETVKELISAGADVNMTAKNGKTPLSIAKERGYGQIANILQQAGAK